MEIKQILAIVRTNLLAAVEDRLIQLGVPGIAVSRVKGFGEYANFLTSGSMSAHVRIEIFADAAQAPRIAEAIVEAAHTGLAGDGFVSVLSVESFYRIRDGRALHELHGPPGVHEAVTQLDASTGPARVDFPED